MGGCGNQRDGAMVEVRETGRCWRSERWGDGGDQRDGRMWKSEIRGDDGGQRDGTVV